MQDQFERDKAARGVAYAEAQQAVRKANERNADADLSDFARAQEIRTRGQVSLPGYALRQSIPGYGLATQMGFTGDPTMEDVAKTRLMTPEQLLNSAEFNKGRASDRFYESNEEIKAEALEEVRNKHNIAAPDAVSYTHLTLPTKA